ncbi:MAG: hypothetical protein IKL52_05575, partial [Candidatus Gastranaerophilales bacterium]|nr:hypothetical protein [Candidatus Gastranaerophilales bacterium]
MPIFNQQRISRLFSSGIDSFSQCQNPIKAVNKLERSPLQDNFQSTLSAKQQKRRKRLEALRNKLRGIIKKSDAASIRKYARQYRKLIENCGLNYDPMSPPTQFMLSDILKGKNIIRFSDITSFSPKKLLEGEMFSADNFKRILNEDGKVSISFPKTQKVVPVICDGAEITSDLPDLGKAVSMKQTIEYGSQIGWSNQKIARDIMQNFYDGHSNTLDGVEMFIEKLPNGKTKIRIEGKGIYKHTQLENTGYSKKSTKRSNAGGFGEGAKVLSNSLLASKKTDSIKYGSSNWIFEYFASEKNKDGYQMLMSRTTLADEKINGNFVEFTTDDDNLVASIIDSINYFNHSKNSDFAQLDFFKGNFGFRILEPSQKGNFYLTQRFEYKNSNDWDNMLDGIRIILTEKPDIEEFKQITGKEFKVARDRLPVQPDEIADLVHYFAYKNMSDDEIISTIKSTMQHWQTIVNTKDKLAIGEFLNGIIKAAKARNIGLDIGSERIVAATNTSDTVVNKLKSCGYILAPKELAEIGIPKSEDIFKFLSVHTPIEPNETQIKKLRLLEEAMVETLRKIDATFFEKVKKVNITFNPKQRKHFSLILSDICDSSTITDFLPNYRQNLDWYKIEKILEKKNPEEIEKMFKAFNLNMGDFISNYDKSKIVKYLIEKFGKEPVYRLFNIAQDTPDWAAYGEFSKIDIQEFMKYINKAQEQFGKKIDLTSYLDMFNLSKKIEEQIANGQISYAKLSEFFKTELSNSCITQAIESLSEQEANELARKISRHYESNLRGLIEQNDKEKIIDFIKNLWESSYLLEAGTKESFRTLLDYGLITAADVRKPRYLFDRFNEISENTLGESIVDIPNKTYSGHWIDKTYFDT